MNKFVQIDTAIFNFINQKCQCKVLDKIMPSITSLANTVPALTIALAMIFWGKIPFLQVFLAGFLTFVIVHIIKVFVKRLRPHILISKVKIMQKLMFYDPSFPSAHTATAAAIATLIALYYPQATLFCIIMTILVGISRSYLGQHYPSDTIIGGIIGWLISYLIYTFI